MRQRSTFPALVASVFFATACEDQTVIPPPKSATQCIEDPNWNYSSARTSECMAALERARARAASQPHAPPTNIDQCSTDPYWSADERVIDCFDLVAQRRRAANEDSTRPRGRGALPPMPPPPFPTSPVPTVSAPPTPATPAPTAAATTASSPAAGLATPSIVDGIWGEPHSTAAWSVKTAPQTIPSDTTLDATFSGTFKGQRVTLKGIVTILRPSAGGVSVVFWGQDLALSLPLSKQQRITRLRLTAEGQLSSARSIDFDKCAFYWTTEPDGGSFETDCVGDWTRRN